MDNDKTIQIIPCVKPLIGVYAPCADGFEYYFSWIYYIGLTEDGGITPIDNLDGFLVSADGVSNFCGAWYGPEGLEGEPYYEQMKKWMEENKP